MLRVRGSCFDDIVSGRSICTVYFQTEPTAAAHATLTDIGRSLMLVSFHSLAFFSQADCSIARLVK